MVDYTGMAENIQIIYKNQPFYLTWTFAIAILLFVIIIAISLYAYFRISLRNRTNVIIHMPDKTRQFHSYKNFVGEIFNIPSSEIDKDGNPILHKYFFRSDAIETGYFGRYIEYDYLNSEPKKYSSSKTSLDYQFISALLNTDLAIDLLLSQKFKDFVKMMLIIIVIGLIINAIISLLPLFISSNNICSLSNDNQTIAIIQYAIKNITF